MRRTGQSATIPLHSPSATLCTRNQNGDWNPLYNTASASHISVSGASNTNISSSSATILDSTSSAYHGFRTVLSVIFFNACMRLLVCDRSTLSHPTSTLSSFNSSRVWPTVFQHRIQSPWSQGLGAVDKVQDAQGREVAHDHESRNRHRPHNELFKLILVEYHSEFMLCVFILRVVLLPHTHNRQFPQPRTLETLTGWFNGHGHINTTCDASTWPVKHCIIWVTRPHFALFGRPRPYVFYFQSGPSLNINPTFPALSLILPENCPPAPALTQPNATHLISHRFSHQPPTKLAHSEYPVVSLPDLPQEMFDEVLSHCLLRDICVLVTMSSTMHQLVHPVIYHHVHITTLSGLQAFIAAIKATNQCCSDLVKVFRFDYVHPHRHFSAAEICTTLVKLSSVLPSLRNLISFVLLTEPLESPYTMFRYVRQPLVCLQEFQTTVTGHRRDRSMLGGSTWLSALRFTHHLMSLGLFEPTPLDDAPSAAISPADLATHPIELPQLRTYAGSSLFFPLLRCNHLTDVCLLWNEHSNVDATLQTVTKLALNLIRFESTDKPIAAVGLTAGSFIPGIHELKFNIRYKSFMQPEAVLDTLESFHHLTTFALCFTQKEAVPPTAVWSDLWPNAAQLCVSASSQACPTLTHIGHESIARSLLDDLLTEDVDA
ncbi:hypothetical protein B0H16DRAFT_1716447 [Mycena metata]|uniref:F-box domain-containing protein n=1 Tax=Mycena metata TaxID=1033252 RepID=A0AAD7NP82_9AGAR|nr:hypothetical protein B0H16DRAFT_1716447 [Mycena metata]